MQTFVIRVQRSSDPGQAGLRGIVEEIATGAKVAFRDGSELVSILTERAEPGVTLAPPGPPRTTWPQEDAPASGVSGEIDQGGEG